MTVNILIIRPNVQTLSFYFNAAISGHSADFIFKLRWAYKKFSSQYVSLLSSLLPSCVQSSLFVVDTMNLKLLISSKQICFFLCDKSFC